MDLCSETEVYRGSPRQPPRANNSPCQAKQAMSPTHRFSQCPPGQSWPMNLSRECTLSRLLRLLLLDLLSLMASAVCRAKRSTQQKFGPSTSAEHLCRRLLLPFLTSFFCVLVPKPHLTGSLWLLYVYYTRSHNHEDRSSVVLSVKELASLFSTAGPQQSPIVV